MTVNLSSPLIGDLFLHGGVLKQACRLGLTVQKRLAFRLSSKGRLLNSKVASLTPSKRYLSWLPFSSAYASGLAKNLLFWLSIQGFCSNLLSFSNISRSLRRLTEEVKNLGMTVHPLPNNYPKA